jgi:hypothetical protein
MSLREVLSTRVPIPGAATARKITFDFYRKVKAQMTAVVKVRRIPCPAL